MRTWSCAPCGQLWVAIARCASMVQWRASTARGNATKNESPWVSTSKPFHSSNAERSSRRCSASRSAYSLQESFQQPRRALDVREQERDRAGRDGRRRLTEPRVIGDAHMRLQLDVERPRPDLPGPARETVAARTTIARHPSGGVSVDTPSEPPLRCPDP